MFKMAQSEAEVTRFVRQIQMEIAVHKVCSGHANIISFLDTAESHDWRWISLEYAEGGDLFDKIEPDVGVEEDIAHLYFTQLVSALEHIHGLGVVHRDIKPENVLLDANGNLKLCDFGLSAVYRHKGQTKKCASMVGSPPYVAPEIVMGGEYEGPPVDLWSCGVVLFVLLLGNTPWDSPESTSPEFVEFVQCQGRPEGGSYWGRVSPKALELLWTLLSLDPAKRGTISQVKSSAWFRRRNNILRNGLCADPIDVAVRLMKKLEVNLSSFVSMSDTSDPLASTQPEYTTRVGADYALRASAPKFFASQPTKMDSIDSATADILIRDLAAEPTMSQFGATGKVLATLTQGASKFRDICPPARMTQFYSFHPIDEVKETVEAAMLQYSVPGYAAPTTDGYSIAVKHNDRHKCLIQGTITISPVKGDLISVKFEKRRGDPLEWRYFFKKITLLCREIVYTGDDEFI